MIMEQTTKNTSILSLLLFITIVALINSAQYMISPNLLTISEYFGFGKNITPLGILAFSFIILSGVAMLILKMDFAYRGYDLFHICNIHY